MSMFQFSGRSVSATVCLLVLLAGSGCGGDKEVVAGPADATSSSPDTGELDSQIVSDVPVAVDTQPVDTSVPDVKSACEKQSDCPEQQCDVLTGQCVACLFDYHCDKGLTCLAQTCEKPTPCLGDKVCLSKGGVCNLEANACVDCNGDADCGEGTVCKLNSCVPASKACKSSKDCAELDQVCDQQSGSCVDCQLDTDCSAETYCADGMCIPDICTKGQTKCKSVTVLQVCNGAGSAYNDLECEADAEACDEGECKKVICQPGEKVCDGVYVKECSARGVDLSISASCTADETCQSGSCLPHICDPGEQKCSSKGVATCADDGLSWVDSLCSSKETCVADAGAATAKCEPHICTPNLPTCDGNAYSICSDDGLNKKIINDCTKLSDGGPGVCLSGACVANSCNAGDKGCAGLATTTCVAGKWQTKSCGPKETCAAGKCVPVSCVPKEIYCDLNVIKLCSPNGDTAKFVKDCASESKPGKPRGCKGGICVDLDCMPGATSCSADNNSVETCKATGFGKVAQQCAAQQTCVTGACKALICTSGQVYCKGNDVMKCDATGTATQKLSTCPKGKICGKGACLNQLCNPGQTQCGDIFGANAGKLETCSADGMAWNASPCASGSACDDGSCKTVICKPTSSICQGSDVMQCNAVGTSFVKKQTCLKTQVCNEGACKTPICKKGVSTCGAGAQSGKLLTCAQSELAWLESSCPAGTICYGGGCKQVLCKMGELGCQGTKQVSCGNNGTSWVPKVDCATNKQVCSEGACKSPICSKGSSSCGVGTQAGALLTCSADQLKWLESKCPVGTTCFSGACKQVVCSMGENSCVGDSVVTCADDGTSWTPSTDCAANKQTCVGGICKSKQCKAGEVQCAGTTVITCNTTGTGWVTQNCSDNNACTPDTCKDGKCQYGASKVCDDKDPCTNDACNVITGQCVTSPASGNCDDGLKCTQGEVCQAGKCQPYEWDLVGTV
nr:hypothetical protein [Myxococcales bacterium]